MSLKVTGLTKNYHQADRELQVLKGLDLEVATSETVAILGESGSGKSTLLALLAGLDRPTEGEIQVGQTRLSQLNEEQLTSFRGRQIGIVFQQYHLMPHFTAIENISLPLEIQGHDFEPAREKAIRALEDVGLKDRATHFPAQLSGGECQRVAIARALIARPKLLLADEPSGNLDDETEKTVMDIFFRLVEENQITGLMVTHSRKLSLRCQRRLTLQQGRLQELRQ